MSNRQLIDTAREIPNATPEEIAHAIQYGPDNSLLRHRYYETERIDTCPSTVAHTHVPRANGVIDVVPSATYPVYTDTKPPLTARSTEKEGTGSYLSGFASTARSIDEVSTLVDRMNPLGYATMSSIVGSIGWAVPMMLIILMGSTGAYYYAVPHTRHRSRRKHGNRSR